MQPHRQADVQQGDTPNTPEETGIFCYIGNRIDGNQTNLRQFGAKK